MSDYQYINYDKRATYFYNIVSQVHGASANTIHWDMYNNSGKLIRVISIRQIPEITIAVTGIAFNWKLSRTTAIGTGGTPLIAIKQDLLDNDLTSNITARSKPTGGATENIILRNYSLHSEETNVGTIVIASMGGLELMPLRLFNSVSRRGLIIRNGQGLRCVQITASVAGNTGWFITFSVE